MITKWLVETNRDSSLSRQEVKDIIRENNYTSIDVGAGVNFWSYPECTIVADILKIDNFSYIDISLRYLLYYKANYFKKKIHVSMKKIFINNN